MDDIVRKIAEDCSREHPKVNELDLVHLRPYMEGFLDSDWLESQLQDYKVCAEENLDPMLQRGILRRPLREFKILPHVGAVLLTSEPNVLLPDSQGTSDIRIYHGREWQFPDGFLPSTPL